MSNNNLTNERLSALIRVARDSLELYEMELPVIDDVMLALAELQQRRAAMLQGVENAETPTTMQTAPALDSSPKIAESPTGINQGKSEPVTTANKLPFEQWLSQQTGTIDVECGCVMTEVFFHWLRVAYEAGNSPVTPDGWVLVPEEPTHEMLEAGDEQFGTYDVYRRMIAASPQQK